MRLGEAIGTSLTLSGGDDHSHATRSGGSVTVHSLGARLMSSRSTGFLTLCSLFSRGFHQRPHLLLRDS